MAQACDLLLTNALVLTMDARFTAIPSGSVAVSGGTIVGVGESAHEYAPAVTVDCSGRVVMPGLVNAHTHAAMTLLRGLAADLPLHFLLMGYIMPFHPASLTPHFL